MLKGVWMRIHIFFLYYLSPGLQDLVNAYVRAVCLRPWFHTTKPGAWIGLGMGKATAQAQQIHSFAGGTARDRHWQKDFTRTINKKQ